jgi:hypothetical protein
VTVPGVADELQIEYVVVARTVTVTEHALELPFSEAVTAAI